MPVLGGKNIYHNTVLDNGYINQNTKGNLIQLNYKLQ